MSDEWPHHKADNLDVFVEQQDAELLRLRAENEKLRAATTPICVGRRIIGILAKEGAWTSEDGASVIAADELFQRDPYEEIEKLRAALKPFADAAERNLGPDDARIVGDCTLGDLRAAAAALKESGE